MYSRFCEHYVYVIGLFYHHHKHELINMINRELITRLFLPWYISDPLLLVSQRGTGLVQVFSLLWPARVCQEQNMICYITCHFVSFTEVHCFQVSKISATYTRIFWTNIFSISSSISIKIIQTSFSSLQLTVLWSLLLGIMFEWTIIICIWYTITINIIITQITNLL